MIYRERCQFESSVYRYPGPFKTLRSLRRAVRRFPDRYAMARGEGKPSRYAAGDWVRVCDAEAIRATLDANGTLRGLAFTAEQWAYCGKTFRVDAVVRRMMNDYGRMTRVSRTVGLDGAACDGPHRDGGCGRSCALLFRDEWLEPSSAALAEPRAHARYARVRPLAEIRATLDARGARDGIAFCAAMERYAGQRFPVHKRVQATAVTWWRRPGAEWYILDGLRCRGESLTTEGPCHRGCGLLWHRDWLELDPA
ncbi:MAG TPA: hypothetical protein VHS78_00045 [Candidatus Elarobacter sp.]|jgi:hypothetical protein|nr:hypothetical protein [Candidatus Elarobacter sp.]